MKYVKRNKFFYAIPSLFPKWDYPSREAIGIKLNDAYYRNESHFKFEVKGKFYRIAREKAIELGNKYTLPFGSLPNLIPIEEFEVVEK